jgi:hypothetical protein
MSPKTLLATASSSDSDYKPCGAMGKRHGRMVDPTPVDARAASDDVTGM